MRHLFTSTLIIIALATVTNNSVGGDPPLSITKSNDFVIFTWPATNGNWQLLQSSRLDRCHESNGVIYCEAYRVWNITGTNHNESGTNISFTLPINYTGNHFYILQTNPFPDLLPSPSP